MKQVKEGKAYKLAIDTKECKIPDEKERDLLIEKAQELYRKAGQPYGLVTAFPKELANIFFTVVEQKKSTIDICCQGIDSCPVKFYYELLQGLCSGISEQVLLKMYEEALEDAKGRARKNSVV